MFKTVARLDKRERYSKSLQFNLTITVADRSGQRAGDHQIPNGNWNPNTFKK